jgi:hypothetical protein
VKVFDIVRLSAQKAPGGSPMISSEKSQSSPREGQLERLRQRLEVWRKSQKPRSRLPGRLWNAAARLAAHHGLNKTAKALHLDYYDLKKRVDAIAGRNGPVPSFVELVPAASSPFPECLIELEARSGTKMRIHLKGITLPDLTTLGSMFWRNNR